MRHSTQVEPTSYLKRHATEITNTLGDTSEPMLITQNGEAQLMVMDVGTWEQHEQSMAMLKLLALGNQIEAGQFRNAEAIMAELEPPAG